MATRRPREGTDFSAYQPGNRQSGWSWLCLHCPTGRGWRWSRVDARKDARTHIAACGGT